jgi:hypothetical protein
MNLNPPWSAVPYAPCLLHHRSWQPLCTICRVSHTRCLVHLYQCIQYYGYGPPSCEYYAPPYPHVMQPRGQSPYIACPPAPYHQQPLHNPHLQPDTAAAPRGMAMSNVIVSSSSLSPSDNTKSS